MLKCICDRGLTTGPEFFRCRIGSRTRGKWYARGRADNADASRYGRRNEDSTRLSFHVCGYADVTYAARGISALTLTCDTLSTDYIPQKIASLCAYYYFLFIIL